MTDLLQANRDVGIRKPECAKATMGVKYSMDTKIENNRHELPVAGKQGQGHPGGRVREGGHGHEVYRMDTEIENI